MTEITDPSAEQKSEDTTVETTADESHSDLPTVHYDDLNTPMIALVGFVSAVVTFICIVGLQAAYLQYEHWEFQQKVVDVRLEEVDSALSAQKSKLHNGYSWVNKEAKTISMPIDQAIKVVAEQYESK